MTQEYNCYADTLLKKKKEKKIMTHWEKTLTVHLINQ